MKKEELIPCPFCGEKGQITECRILKARYAPRCSNKKCLAHNLCREFSKPAKAKYAWNTRK